MTFKMTIDVLEALGSCGTYSSRFRSLFPESDERYEEGVELTADVCAEHYEQFDWGWAYETMLNYEGQRRFKRRTNNSSREVEAFETEERRERDRHRSAIRRWREKYNEPHAFSTNESSEESRAEFETLRARHAELMADINKRRSQHTARVFGELVGEEQYRSDRLVSALRQGEQLREQRERNELTVAEQAIESAKYDLRSAERYAEQYARDVERLRQRLPELEKQLVETRARFYERAVQRAERALPRLQEELEAEKRAAEERIAQRQREAEEQLAQNRRILEEARAAAAATVAPVEETPSESAESTAVVA